MTFGTKDRRPELRTPCDGRANRARDGKPFRCTCGARMRSSLEVAVHLGRYEGNIKGSLVAEERPGDGCTEDDLYFDCDRHGPEAVA